MMHRVLAPLPTKYRLRLARFISDRISHRAPNRPELYPVDGGAMYLNLAESRMMAMRAIGMHEPEKHALIKRLLKPGMTFLDVGANKGDFSVLAASIVGDEGRVIAIEPEPHNWEDLARNIALNGFTNVSTHQLALGDFDGRSTLYLGQKSGWHTLKSGQRQQPVGEVEIEVATMDAMIRSLGVEAPDLVKIDVEGSEVEVIKGAEATIARAPEIVLLIDLHPQMGANLDALEEMFLRHNISSFEMEPPHRRLDRLPRVACDVVATRQQELLEQGR